MPAMTPLQKTWQTFTAAPHRMMMLGGAIQGVLTLLWWLFDLLGRYGGLYAAQAWSIAPVWAHAFLMLYGFFPFFVFGFLMTTYPNWMNGEKIPPRLYIPAFLLLAGGIALFYLRHIMTYDLHAEISGRHIIYKSAVLHPFGKIPTLIYLVPTLVPFFVSSLKRAYIMGIIMFLSFVVSAVAYREYLTSVWCFFAAVMSFVIYYIIRDSRKSTFLKPVADAVKSI